MIETFNNIVKVNNNKSKCCGVNRRNEATITTTLSAWLLIW